MNTNNKQLDAFKTWLNNIQFDGLNCASRIELTDYVAGCLDGMSELEKDKQRIDWLLRECEMRLLDDNGAPYGQDLTSRSEIDAEIQSQNIPVTSTAPN